MLLHLQTTVCQSQIFADVYECNIKFLGGLNCNITIVTNVKM